MPSSTACSPLLPSLPERSTTASASSTLLPSEPWAYVVCLSPSPAAPAAQLTLIRSTVSLVPGLRRRSLCQQRLGLNCRHVRRCSLLWYLGRLFLVERGCYHYRLVSLCGSLEAATGELGLTSWPASAPHRKSVVSTSPAGRRPKLRVLLLAALSTSALTSTAMVPVRSGACPVMPFIRRT